MKHEQAIYGVPPSKSMKRVSDDALIESYSRTGNVNTEAIALILR